MLNSIFWNKSPCDGISLKSFLQVVSCELDFKDKSVFGKGIQYWGMLAFFAFWV